MAALGLTAASEGAAGSPAAFFAPSVTPDWFPAVESFPQVITAVVGGPGTGWGGVVGAVVMSRPFLPRGLVPSAAGSVDEVGRRLASGVRP